MPRGIDGTGRERLPRRVIPSLPVADNPPPAASQRYGPLPRPIFFS